MIIYMGDKPCHRGPLSIALFWQCAVIFHVQSEANDNGQRSTCVNIWGAFLLIRVRLVFFSLGGLFSFWPLLDSSLIEMLVLLYLFAVHFLL